MTNIISDDDVERMLDDLLCIRAQLNPSAQDFVDELAEEDVDTPLHPNRIKTLEQIWKENYQ